MTRQLQYAAREPSASGQALESGLGESWIVLALAVLPLIVWLMPPLTGLNHNRTLSWHGVLEVLEIAMSALVFVTGWRGYGGRGTASAVLACGFLAVGLIDLGHFVVSEEIPGFINSQQEWESQSIYFDLAARTAASAAMLGFILLPTPRNGTVLLGTTLLLVWLVYWAQGLGMAALQPGSIHSLASIAGSLVAVPLLLSAWLLARPTSRRRSAAANGLFVAACMMALGEYAMVIYPSKSESLNLLGHVYRVVGYFLVYRAVFARTEPGAIARESESSASESVALAADPPCAIPGNDVFAHVGLYGSREDERSRLIAILEETTDLVCVTSADWRSMLYLNRAGRLMLGIGEDEDIFTLDMHGFYPDSASAAICEQASAAALQTGVWRKETSILTRYGLEIPVSQVTIAHKEQNGEVACWSTIIRDIRELKLLEAKLTRQATHDSLTGLPNRLLFQDRMEQALARARRQGSRVAVMFLDLDNFKNINDSLGHSQGDALLKQVAGRMATMLRQDDTVARLGGDEFILLLQDANRRDEIAAVAEKLLRILSAPFYIDGSELFVTASIGITIYPNDDQDSNSLLGNADVAMYRAKQLGRNNFQFFTLDLNRRMSERLTIETRLRHALENDEFSMCYQPKVNLDNRSVSGMEALLRWNNPELGAVAPDKFIPIAEETGLIQPIGDWVLKMACRQNRMWQDQGLPNLRVAVNLSARQFKQRGLARHVRRILDETGLAPQCLELEITESTVMNDREAAVETMRELASIGINLSIDDFGTGYSSLSYLKIFPIHCLKIDRSFIKDVTTSADNAAITRAIISMSHSLNLRVVAEGVETEAQLAFLSEHRCNEIQGYYFSKPLACDRFIDYFARMKPAGC